MDSGRTGSESQDSDELAPSGTLKDESAKSSTSSKVSKQATSTPGTTSKGIENAKKRLRAFSIQKKTPLTPITVPKTVSTGSSTVLIGKLSSVKTGPKVEKVEDDVKKPPKPPKPGSNKKYLQESYTELQKQTISEIEDMKRKMELVELGIPLGLICPNTTEKAMPTKAMPPIKSFLDTAKVDELIREAKKARAEGKEFKFDYKKLLPDYDNPFQRKKEDPRQEDKKEIDNKEEQWKAPENERKYTEKLTEKQDYQKDRDAYRDKHKDKSRERKNRDAEDHKERHDKHKERDKHTEKDAKYKNKDDKKELEGDKSKDREPKKEDKEKTSKEQSLDRDTKEADVNLNDYLVCDSWSLDTSNSSPQVDDKKNKDKYTDPMTQLKQSLKRRDGSKSSSCPKEKPKMEKLKPVNDSFKYEIDPNEDEVLDIYDEGNNMETYTNVTQKDSPANVKYGSKDTSMDGMNDDNFLESVINEIKQENISDGDSQDKGLVEYDSPLKDDFRLSQGSRTPELNTSTRGTDSQRSDYSDGYRSTDSRKSVESYKSSDSGRKSTDSGHYKSSESGRKSAESSHRSIESAYKSTETSHKSRESAQSYKRAETGHSSAERGYKGAESGYKDTESGYKSTESGYKSTESGYKSGRSTDTRSSIERELDEDMAMKMPQWTVDSLETWSFVLKICQPLLFRHDRNKCYMETRVTPKVWYTVNPKLCNCVKDRSVVYEELEMCKMAHVDQLYSSQGPSENPPSSARSWYPRVENFLMENPTVPMSSEWDIDVAQEPQRSLTPDMNEEEELDIEYQKFIQALWPEVADMNTETCGSTTPVKKKSRKKKKTEEEAAEKSKKSAKKIKLSSKSWSQESEVEEEVEKPKKPKEKLRKRKRSSSTLTSDGDSEGSKKKKKKKSRKKSNKKFKIKEAKKRKLAKKLQKLKDRKKKKKTEDSEFEEEIETKKKDKKLKKKKLQKNKKKSTKKKKKASSSSSSSSSSSETSSSDTEMEVKKKKKKKDDDSRKKKKEKKKKRKQSTSDSTQSDDLFDVNVLNNIKTERIDDDSRNKMQQDFSPRQQKPKENREIISVKELHQDFSNHIQVKKEIEMDSRNEAAEKRISEKTESDTTVAEKPTEISPEKKIAEDKKEADKSVVEKVEVEKRVEKSVEETMNTFNLGEDEQTSKKQEKILRQEPQPPPMPVPPVNPETPQPIAPVTTTTHPGYEAMEVDDNYEQGNYEMYEQLAMQYQSDVASQRLPESSPNHGGSMRIETVVRTRPRGEIKCDWRAGDTLEHSSAAGTQPVSRPSRWGLKPGEVNIVLTGADPSPDHGDKNAVFNIPSLANRHHDSSASTGYDEAYMATYGVSDRLQYGDCFATASEQTDIDSLSEDKRTSLDQRISRALRDTVLGEVAREAAEADKETSEKGILVSKPSSAEASRGAKRVSFADGYKPGQDSDVEEPPVKKKKKRRRYGCAWPCPAGHPDHVSLWDALPPPPPPAGSPPPPPGSPPPQRPAPPPLHLLRQPQHQQPFHPFGAIMPHPQFQPKFDPSAAMPNFMPPEPPPGLINFT